MAASVAGGSPGVAASTPSGAPKGGPTEVSVLMAAVSQDTHNVSAISADRDESAAAGAGAAGRGGSIRPATQAGHEPAGSWASDWSSGSAVSSEQVTMLMKQMEDLTQLVHVQREIIKAMGATGAGGSAGGGSGGAGMHGAVGRSADSDDVSTTSQAGAETASSGDSTAVEEQASAAAVAAQRANIGAPMEAVETRGVPAVITPDGDAAGGVSAVATATPPTPVPSVQATPLVSPGTVSTSTLTARPQSVATPVGVADATARRLEMTTRDHGGGGGGADVAAPKAMGFVVDPKSGMAVFKSPLAHVVPPLLHKLGDAELVAFVKERTLYVDKCTAAGVEPTPMIAGVNNTIVQYLVRAGTPLDTTSDETVKAELYKALGMKESHTIEMPPLKWPSSFESPQKFVAYIVQVAFELDTIEVERKLRGMAAKLMWDHFPASVRAALVVIHNQSIAADSGERPVEYGKQLVKLTDITAAARKLPTAGGDTLEYGSIPRMWARMMTGSGGGAASADTRESRASTATDGVPRGGTRGGARAGARGGRGGFSRGGGRGGFAAAERETRVGPGAPYVAPPPMPPVAAAGGDRGGRGGARGGDRGRGRGAGRGRAHKMTIAPAHVEAKAEPPKGAHPPDMLMPEYPYTVRRTRVGACVQGGEERVVHAFSDPGSSIACTNVAGATTLCGDDWMERVVPGSVRGGKRVVTHGGDVLALGELRVMLRFDFVVNGKSVCAHVDLQVTVLDSRDNGFEDYALVLPGWLSERKGHALHAAFNAANNGGVVEYGKSLEMLTAHGGDAVALSAAVARTGALPSRGAATPAMTATKETTGVTPGAKKEKEGSRRDVKAATQAAPARVSRIVTPPLLSLAGVHVESETKVLRHIVHEAAALDSELDVYDKMEEDLGLGRAAGDGAEQVKRVTLAAGLPNDVHQRFDDVLREFAEVFGPVRAPAKTPSVDIHVTDETPFDHSRRLSSRVNIGAVKEKLEQWESAGIIVKNDKLRFINALHVVQKPGSTSVRPVLAALELNRRSVRATYPLPSTLDCVQFVARGTYFAKFDCASAFLQLELDEASRQYAGFEFAGVRYAFTRLFFGWCNSSEEWQRFVDDLVRGLDGTVAYIDDIMVVAETLDELLRRVVAFLKRVRARGVRLSAEKCVIGATEVEYLGHVVGGGAYNIAPAFTDALRYMPPPRNLKEARSQMAALNWVRGHVPGFGTEVEPLLVLLEHNAVFGRVFTPEKAALLAAFKLRAANTIALLAWDGREALTVMTDASDVGWGAMVAVERAAGGSDTSVLVPVAFGSGRFNKGEMDETVTYREVRALVLFARKWPHYFEHGNPVTWLTDHNNTTFIATSLESQNLRVRRMAAELARYNIVTRHVPGVTNVVADGLSRSPMEDAPARLLMARTRRALEREARAARAAVAGGGAGATSTEESAATAATPPETTTRAKATEKVRAPSGPATPTTATTSLQGKPLLQRIAAAQRTDQGREDIEKVAGAALEHRDGVELWTRNGNIILPNDAGVWAAVLDGAHDKLGHRAVDGTLAMLAAAQMEGVDARAARDAVRKHIGTCVRCQQVKAPRNPPRHGEYTIADVMSGPGVNVMMDVKGPMVKGLATGSTAILVVIDLFTHYTELYPLKDMTAAAVIAAFRLYCLRHGVPKTLRTDGGSHFDCEQMVELADELGFKHHISAPRHPQSQGVVERCMRELGEQLRLRVDAKPQTWDKHLPDVASVLNGHVNRSIGISPFEATYGYPCRTALVARTGAPPLVYDDVSTLQGAVRLVREAVARNAKRGAEERKRVYDESVTPVKLEPGDHVLVHEHRSHKLEADWYGPCRVVGADPEHANTMIVRDINLEKDMSIHVDRLLPFNISRTTVEREIFRQNADVGVLEAKEIAEHEWRDDALYFRVRWEPDGFTDASDSWEPLDTVRRLALYTEYAAKHDLGRGVARRARGGTGSRRKKGVG